MSFLDWKTRENYVKNQGKFQFQKIFAAHLRNSHGTLVCRGTQFENH